MSEGRQLVLLLVGALLLAALGIVAATAFPEPCEEVEGIGSLELSFTGAAEALALPADEGAAVEALGDRLGIGGWRGAVVLPADTRVLPSDFGFFAVTDTDLVALRPGSRRASAPRDVAGLDVVAVGGTSAGLVAPDRTIAVISSDYERERCGTLPADGDVLAVDRGFALLATADGGGRLVTLSGEDLGTVRLGSPVLAGLLEGDRTVLVTAEEAVATTVSDGVVVDRVATPGALPLASVHGRVLLVEAADPGTVVAVEVDADGGLSTRDVPADGTVLAAAPTPAGTIVLTSDGLGTDRVGAVRLPSEVVATGLVASEDGQVGLLVDGPSTPVLLVWGRDLPG